MCVDPPPNKRTSVCSIVRSARSRATVPRELFFFPFSHKHPSNSVCSAVPREFVCLLSFSPSALTPGSGTSRPRRCHNSRPHGSSTSSSTSSTSSSTSSTSSSTSSTSRDFRSHNSRDRSTSSPIPGAAGREHLTISSPTPGEAGKGHLPNSGEEERLTSGDHNIGEEISHTSSAPCVSSAARMSISPQTT